MQTRRPTDDVSWQHRYLFRGSTLSQTIAIATLSLIAVWHHLGFCQTPVDTSASDSSRLEKLEQQLKTSGIAGRWIVRSVKVQGKLSKAQIGQEAGDIIEIGGEPQAIT